MLVSALAGVSALLVFLRPFEKGGAFLEPLEKPLIAAFVILSSAFGAIARWLRFEWVPLESDPASEFVTAAFFVGRSENSVLSNALVVWPDHIHSALVDFSVGLGMSAEILVIHATSGRVACATLALARMRPASSVARICEINTVRFLGAASFEDADPIVNARSGSGEAAGRGSDCGKGPAAIRAHACAMGARSAFLLLVWRRRLEGAPFGACGRGRTDHAASTRDLLSAHASIHTACLVRVAFVLYATLAPCRFTF